MMHTRSALLLATIALLALPGAADASVTVTIGPDVFVVDDAIVATEIRGPKYGLPPVLWTTAYLSTGRKVIGNEEDGVIVESTSGASWGIRPSSNVSTTAPTTSVKPDRCLTVTHGGWHYKIKSRDCRKARQVGRRVRRHGTGAKPGRRVVVKVKGTRVIIDPITVLDRSHEVAARAARIVECGSASKIGLAIAYATSPDACPAALEVAYAYAPLFGRPSIALPDPGCVVVGDGTRVCAGGIVIEDGTSDRRMVRVAADEVGAYWSAEQPVLDALAAS